MKKPSRALSYSSIQRQPTGRALIGGGVAKQGRQGPAYPRRMPLAEGGGMLAPGGIEPAEFVDRDSQVLRMYPVPRAMLQFQDELDPARRALRELLGVLRVLPPESGIYDARRKGQPLHRAIHRHPLRRTSGGLPGVPELSPGPSARLGAAAARREADADLFARRVIPGTAPPRPGPAPRSSPASSRAGGAAARRLPALPSLPARGSGPEERRTPRRA